MAEIKHFDDLYPNRFLKAGNLGDKPVTLTIAGVAKEMLEGEKGVEQRVTLSFERTPKQLVLCKLNAMCIRAMFGSKVPTWVGKRIALYATDQIMPMPTRKGDDRFCIRVWGSPDIAADIAFQWAPPKRKALSLTMRAMRRQEPAPQPVAPSPVCPSCGAVTNKGTCPQCG